MTETNSRKEHNLEVMVHSGGTNTAEIGKTRMLTPSRGVGFTVNNLARGKDVEASWHGFDRGSKPSYVPVHEKPAPNQEASPEESWEKHMNNEQEVDGITNLRQDLEILADVYHAPTDGLSHRHIAEAMGQSFALQCLEEYGVQGFQMADSGIRAILETLREKSKSQS